MSRDDARLRELDREARRRACELFDRTLVLEAGAGTGKTAVLVARAITWLLGPGWEATAAGEDSPSPEQIAGKVLDGLVAITFTEAAAAEMAERIGAGLLSLAGGAAPAAFGLGELPTCSRERAATLLARLERLRVQTIHSFCRSLLTSDPLAAGLHPRFTVDADGEATAEIVRDVLDERLRAGYAAGEPPLLELARHGIGPWEIGEALSSVIASGGRAADLAPDPLARERIESLLARTRRTTHELAACLESRLGDSGRVTKAREVAAALREVSQLADSLAPLPAALGRLREWSRAALAAIEERLSAWARGAFTETEAKVIAAEAGAVAARSREVRRLLRHLEKLDPDLLAAGRAVLAPLLAEVEESRRRAGLVSFDELLRRAVELLRDRPAVRRRVRAGLRQILVDEFQDTDPLQCELLSLLALEEPRDARPGLFLVGDPKQSIYGWRRADLAAYDRFLTRVLSPEVGGERAVLSVNFRSVPAVLEEVERAAAPLFQAELGVQPRYTPLVASERNAGRPGTTVGGRSPVEHWISWAAERRDGFPPAPRATGASEANRLEAVAIARDLVALRDAVAKEEVDRPWRWSDVALLFRVTSDQETYLEALREAGIPFQVDGDRSFFQRREVLDATSLVRAVLDPGDALALVATLRSPWIGVPDAALLPLWSEQLPGRLSELEDPDPQRLRELAELVTRAAEATPKAPGVDLVADWPVALLAAIEGIARLRDAYRTLPADRFVAELRAWFPFEALSAARYLGRFRLANLTRWLSRLTEALLAARGDVDAVLRRLRRAVAEAEEDPAGALVGQADAVRILTIHKAKGLDFDQVYLPQLHHGSARSSASRPIFQGGAAPEYSLFGAPTLGLDELLAHQERTTAAERARLLYVAMTRARQRTVTLGSWPPHGGGGREDSLLSLLSGTRGQARPPLPGTGADPASCRDSDGVLWRCLGLEGAPPTRAEAVHEETEGFGDPELARRIFAARRADAAHRANRPLVAGVTASLDRLEVEHEEEAARSAEASSSALAVSVGAAVHRYFEWLDSAEPPEAERARLSPALQRELGRRLRPDQLAEATSRLDALLDRLIRGGELLARLRAIAPFIVAREMPILLAAGGSDSGPLAARVGALDLFYRDPENGEPVVADFKTDRFDSDLEMKEEIARHAPQLRAYGAAIAAAFDLPSPPRLELWMVAADRRFSVPWQDPALE